MVIPHSLGFLLFFLSRRLSVECDCRCDGPKPGDQLTTRQPAEIYKSHVMRLIHVQKWPLGPTHNTHKMYILYKNDLFSIVFNYNLYKTGSLAQNFTKIQEKTGLAISSTLRFRMRPIPKCVFGT